MTGALQEQQAKKEKPGERMLWPYVPTGMKSNYDDETCDWLFYIIGSISRFLLKFPGFETSTSSFMVPIGCRECTPPPSTVFPTSHK